MRTTLRWAGFLALLSGGLAAALILRRRGNAPDRRISFGLADDTAHAIANAMPHEPGAWSARTDST